MGFLFALILSFAVESKGSVTPSGDIPSGMEVDYSYSRQGDKVLEGDETQLTLTGLGGIAIEHIEISMRSNKSGGAGTISVLVDDQQVASMSGTFKSWTGAYDNVTYHPIEVLSQTQEDVHRLSIRINGTANSLYIERFDIRYQAAAAHSVTLMKGSDIYTVLTEVEGGAGVTLPMMNDTAEWHFIGWTGREFYTEYTKPYYFPANSLFSPDTDTTLWACYIHRQEEADTYISELQTGEYLYVNKDLDLALSGVPQDGRMVASTIDAYENNQYYRIEFSSPDTAFITHSKTNTPIGFSGTKLTNKRSPWLVYHENEETLFYTLIGKQLYALWLNIHDTHTGGIYTGLLPADSWTNSPMRLMKPKEQQTPAYTCHPECGVGIETVKEEHRNVSSEEWVFPFGNYELHIKNGNKYILLK